MSVLKRLVCMCLMSITTITVNAQDKSEIIGNKIENFMDGLNFRVIGSIGSFHDRNHYSERQIKYFNERNEGYGLGLRYVSKVGNEHSLNYLKIKDSNYNDQQSIQYQYAYNFLKADFDIQAGAVVGLMKRQKYSKKETFIMPFAAPVVGVKYKDLSLNVLYAPEFKYNNENLGGFIYGWLTYDF